MIHWQFYHIQADW
uniref:Uncharacterized protein n=1 Tax=Rhizophora mucronata TaxID=61149 RepID=A0A2P2PE29_RHIMU